MADTGEESPLLANENGGLRRKSRPHDGDADSVLDLFVSKSEQRLGDTYVGERLPYSDYSSIDFLHDLVGAHQHHSPCPV